MLLFETHGLSDPSDPVQYPKPFRKVSADCVASFVVRCSEGFLRYAQDSVQDRVLKTFGTAVPEGLDRTLAQICTYTYLGVTDSSWEA
eukprot:5508236-Karenia_brevis.AAC.1